MNQYMAYLGLLATAWVVIGATITAKKYPGYQHSRQLLSELGAKDSPTEQLSPLINNYPLSIIFLLLGGYIIQSSHTPALAITGSLIMLHGIATMVAGYFPMDANPYTKAPSLNGQRHWLAGIAISTTLLFAAITTLFTNTFPTSFTFFTLVCIGVSVLSTWNLKVAFDQQGKLGLHQRYSYGAQLVWLCGLSIALAQR